MNNKNNGLILLNLRLSISIIYDKSIKSIDFLLKESELRFTSVNVLS